MAPHVGAISLEEASRSRSVATADMLDHDFTPAPFADRHITTGSTSAVAPIVIVPIEIAMFAADSVAVTAVRSNADIQLSKRDFGFGGDGIPSISGGCRESPHCARDGDDKWHFSHSDSSFANDTAKPISKKTTRSFVGNGH